MVNLSNTISGLGTPGQRGLEAVAALKQMNRDVGLFTHNGFDLIVYQDSTAREIAYQYQAAELRKQISEARWL